MDKIRKKQLMFVIIMVGLVCLIGVGISYAYYVASFNVENQDKSNSSITSASITNVIMDIKSKEITTHDVFPGHIDLKEFTIRGNGDSKVSPTAAAIRIIPELGVFQNDVTWQLYKSDEEITCISEAKHSDGQYYEEASCDIPDSAVLELTGGSDADYKNILVYPDTETKYYLIVFYANKENQDNQQGESYKINIDLSNKVTTTDDIITQVDTSGKCPIVNDDGSVSNNDAESTDGYLCSAPDTYGTSYYFRGNVVNNYVYFAGFYWRIVRINGDCSIRIIYDGTKPHENGESSLDRQIGTSAFNEKYADNAYVGYMYGTPGSSTYEETHLNINDSTIKKYIDNWYVKNIKYTEYEEYLADNLFCNDRSLSSTNTGTGAGQVATSYRLSTIDKLILTCPQRNDAFTVSDTTNGNGVLTYPVGLLTADELLLAGDDTSGNSGYYLYTGFYERLMSPTCYRQNSAYNYGQHGNGSLNANYPVDVEYGVRAVLNLKPKIKLIGTGTLNDPYKISLK